MRPLAKILDIAYRYTVGSIQKLTRIPASVMTRIIRGVYNPSASTLKKLKDMDTRVLKREKYRIAREADLSAQEARVVRSMNVIKARKYVKLREAGAMPYHAKHYADMSHEYVEDLADRYRKVRNLLSKKHKVKIEHIARGMSFSERNIDEWEEYVQRKKFKKRGR